MARKRLQPGETTIDSAAPRSQEIDGDTYMLLRWSGRLMSGKAVRKSTNIKVQSGSGATLAGPLRRRARQAWEEILAEEAGESKSDADAPMAEVLEEVADRMEEDNLDPQFARLRPDTRTRYRLSLRKLAEVFGSQTIEEASQPEALREAILFIRNENLKNDPKPRIESARQARNVLSAYVLDELTLRKVIPRNELRSMKIVLKEGTKRPKEGYKPKPTGPKALTEQEWEQVRDYLLARDVSKDPVSRQGRWTPEHRRAATQAAIDLSLLQLATGLRFFEALQIENEMVIDDGTNMLIHVPDWVAKTKKARTVGVLDAQVTQRLRKRRHELGGTYLIGSPHDPDKPWDRSNARGKTRTLYNEELAKIVPLLGEPGVGGHIWRATLNEMYLDSVPEVDRIRQFGHTAAINRSRYTTSGATRIMAAAAAKGNL